MILSIDTLRDYLWHQFGILPESVRLNTHLWQELLLTDSDVKALVQHVGQSLGYSFPDDLMVVSHLSDILDLMVYALLHASEEREPNNHFGESVWPINSPLTNEWLLFSQRMDQQPNLN